MSIAKQPVFEVGETVVATGSYYCLLTEGKQYTVIKYEEEFRDGAFTWPAYVTVVGDGGRSVTGHTHRFRPLLPHEALRDG